MSTKKSKGASDRGYYFFLSYAHTAPSLEQEEPEDYWVTAFYRALCAEVRRIAGPNAPLEPGFMEEEQLPLSTDWTGRVARAIAATEVFVPLLSPAYASRSWPVSEWASFRARLADLPADRAARHIQPVLWVPFAKGKTTDGLEEALELGADVPQYRRNGLLALSRLTLFQDQYETILARLATRIVQAARDIPVGRSSHPVPIAVKQPTSQQSDFVVGVIAPNQSEAGAGLNGHGMGSYGETATAWRPFQAPQVPAVSEYVATVAQRLGLGTETTDLLSNSDALAEKSGLALIDPSILSLPGGRARLQAAVKALPEWVILMLLADENDSKYAAGGERLVTEAVDVLHGHPEYVVKYARDVSEFIQLVPTTITQARRRFLNRAPRASEPRRTRPSLRRPNPPTTD